MSRTSDWLRSGTVRVRFCSFFSRMMLTVTAAALAPVHGVSEIAAVADGFSVDFHDHIAGAESGLLGAATFFHRAHQNSLAVFRAEKISQLGSEVLHHQSAARGGVHHHD